MIGVIIWLVVLSIAVVCEMHSHSNLMYGYHCLIKAIDGLIEALKEKENK